MPEGVWHCAARGEDRSDGQRPGADEEMPDPCDLAVESYLPASGVTRSASVRRSRGLTSETKQNASPPWVRSMTLKPRTTRVASACAGAFVSAGRTNTE